MLFKFHVLILFALLALLSSCTLMRSLETTAAKTQELAAAAADTLVEAKATFAEAKAKADTDGDGKTDASEWMVWLLGAGGLGGLGGLGALAKGAIRNAKSDGRKDIIEGRLHALENTAT